MFDRAHKRLIVLRMNRRNREMIGEKGTPTRSIRGEDSREEVFLIDFPGTDLRRGRGDELLYHDLDPRAGPSDFLD